MSNPFPGVPPHKFNNDLWALDQLNQGHLVEENASRYLDDLASSYNAWNTTNEVAAAAKLNQIDRQIKAIDNSIGRTLVYEEEGLISSIDAAHVKEALTEMSTEMKALRGRMADYLSKWNDAAKEMFESIGKSVDSIIAKGLAKRGKSLVQAAKDAQKALDTAQSAFATAQKSQLKAADEYFNRAAGTSEAETKRLKQVWEQSINTTKETSTALDAAHKASLVAKDASEVVQKSISGLTRFDALDKVNGAMKKIGFDMAAGWTKVERLAKEVHKSVDILTKGYEKHLAKFLNDEEEASAFWKEARSSSEKMSAKQSERVEREITELNKLAKAGKTDEFLIQAAKYNTPSMRQYALIRDEFTTLRESSFETLGYWTLLDARWIGLGVTTASRASIGLMMRGLEAVIGDTAAIAVETAVTAVISFGSEVLTKLLGPEVLAIQLAVELTIDLIRHGFGWRFLDDILGFVGLSLAQVDPYGALQEYPKFSKAGPALTDKTDPLKLNQYDSEELAVLLDFWGEVYIDQMNKRGHKYPKYTKLKPFSAIKRISGQYIDPNNHPFELQAELDECRQIEHDLDLGILVGTDEIGAGSQTAGWYPKKEGLVRNLVAFPAYETSFHWPSLDGDIHQIGGWFNKASLDSTIYSALVLWAQSGTYGPIYNSSVSSKARNAAVQQNKLDVAQWLNPQSNYYTSALELDDWIQSNRGRKSVYVSEMILLAPDLFEKEWTTNPAIRKTIFATRNVFNTIEYYTQERGETGRWMYYKNNQNFYNKVITHHITNYEKSVLGAKEFAERTSTPSEIELFTKVMADGQAYRELIRSKSSETKEAWDQFVLEKLWPEYVRIEKPFRTVFGYVQKYKGLFLQDLQAVCNWFLGESRDKAWKHYSKLKAQAHIPLNMDSAHRVAFMGRFAQLAYATDTHKGKELEKELEQRFGKLLENDVVTTRTHKDGIGKWAKLVKHFIFGTIEQNKLFPKMFGDLHCRMFVLDNPRVIVIAFRGTTNLFEWTINADFMAADFMRVKPQKSGIVVPDVAKHEAYWPGGDRTLFEDQSTLMVHRGFLRGYTTLSKGIESTMLEYMKKYDIEDVFITGHSLGAALTQMAGMLIPRLPFTNTRTGEKTMKNPHCYMFSSPTVGDVRFQDHFTAMTGETAQIWNDGDIVTSVPLFLMPARDITLSGYNDSLDSFKKIAGTEEASPFAGLLWGFSTLFELGDLTSIFDTISLREFKSYDLSQLMAHSGQIYHALVQYKPLRGGGAFFRLDYNTKGYFEEFPEDPGNTAWLFRMIANAVGNKQLAFDVHSLDNVMDNFDYIARTDTDAFALNNKDLPAWSGGGGIKPHRLPDRVLKTSTIIGYAHTKHHHKSYTVVDKDDVDETDMLLIPQEMSVNVARAAKRHKHNLKDASYHGSHYY